MIKISAPPLYETLNCLMTKKRNDSGTSCMCRNAVLKSKIKVLKKKEAEDAKALEDMVQKVESNLVTTTVSGGGREGGERRRGREREGRGEGGREGGGREGGRGGGGEGGMGGDRERRGWGGREDEDEDRVNVLFSVQKRAVSAEAMIKQLKQEVSSLEVRCCIVPLCICRSNLSVSEVCPRS